MTDHVVYPVGVQKILEHLTNANPLDTDIYSVVLADTYDPVADKYADHMDTATIGVVSHYWGATLQYGGEDTSTPLAVSPITVTTSGDDVALNFGDLDFGQMSIDPGTTPKYLLLYVEDSTPADDEDRYPLACLHFPFEFVSGDVLEFVTDATGVVLWRVPQT